MSRIWSQTINSLKNVLLGFIKIILIVISTIKKIQVDKNGCEYILFRIDAYFSEYSLAVKIDEKGYTDRDFIFEEKKTKNIVVNLLELIQAM